MSFFFKTQKKNTNYKWKRHIWKTIQEKKNLVIERKEQIEYLFEKDDRLKWRDDIDWRNETIELIKEDLKKNLVQKAILRQRGMSSEFAVIFAND